MRAVRPQVTRQPLGLKPLVLRDRAILAVQGLEPELLRRAAAPGGDLEAESAIADAVLDAVREAAR